MSNDHWRHPLRHTLATLAYRAEKALRDAPREFADFRLSPSTRTPVEIVSHLADLMDWAERMARGEYKWTAQPVQDWQIACDRFFGGLRAVDDALVASTFDVHPGEMLLQGPLADALTHVGQLTMLRGAAGSPVRPESYARAEIQVGRVGRDQSASRKEFDGDASKPRPT